MPDDGYPYLHLSRRIGVQYADVLALADYFDNRYVMPGYWTELSEADKCSVHRVWERETERQRRVKQKLLDETGQDSIGRRPSP